MSVGISVITDGIEIPISTIGKLVAHDGWGMPPVNRYSEAGPLQHGTTDRGYRLDERIGKFVFSINKTTLEEMYTKRAEIISYFSPAKNLKVKFTNGAIVKVIDCKYGGDFSLPWDVSSWAAGRFAISLKCNDPTFYDPSIRELFFGGGGGTGFVVPIVTPFRFGASTLSMTQSINNLGDADEYPVIRVIGQIEDPVITNTTYGEKLDFTGTHIAAGVTYQIDCRYGYKTVVELPSTDRIDKLTDDSKLSTFRLRPGLNDISVWGGNITSATSVIIDYYNRYLGV